SAGVLVSIEAIAWFLLRQYRALVEDYKAFHRIYMRRRTFLVAYKLFEGGEAGEGEKTLVLAMLADDWTGKLSAGQTTESIEANKLLEANPFSALIGRLADLLSPLRSAGK